MKDWQRWLLMFAGLGLAFLHPILAFTSPLTKISPQAVTGFYPTQVLTVPLGLVLFGLAIELRRARGWLLVFVVFLPVIFLAGLFAQVGLCGLYENRC